MDQTQFDFASEEAGRRRRRRVKRRQPKPRPNPEAPPALVEAPFLQRCGFCGHHQTVLAESAMCDHCGGIILRDETPE